MNNPIAINQISNLELVQCTQVDCHYNQWLVKVQNNIADFIATEEQNKYIEYHKHVKTLSKKSIQNAVVIEQNKEESEAIKREMVLVLHSLIKNVPSIDFFDAVFNHFKELQPVYFSILITPDALLRAKLEDKLFPESKFLVDYIAEKKQSINTEEFYHSLFGALKNNQVDVLKVLLTIKKETNSFGSCWNTNHCCITEKNIINAFYDFIINNISDKDLIIDIMFNILLKTEYLDQPTAKTLMFVKLAQNKSSKGLFDILYKILQTYITDKNQDYIFFDSSALSKNTNITNIAKELTENCTAEQLDTELDKFNGLSDENITDCKKLYYYSKFKIDVKNYSETNSIVFLYKLMKIIKEIL